PVIITKYVGISPSIKKAGAGLVINKDEKQLTEAILKILNNPDLAKKISEAGKKLTEKEFSWPEIAEKFINEYGEIINFKHHSL
ncbi:glycosyltransferase family 4 protein, partial [Candidatus Wolfebacteria bacterium]|nr:glycosyltransferase family 4 protein [Candidatus Wolfebacteria bacterium]